MLALDLGYSFDIEYLLWQLYAAETPILTGFLQSLCI